MGMQVDLLKFRDELETRMSEHDLTANEFAFVIFLGKNSNLQVNELAEMLSVSSPTIVSRLNSLEDKNYLVRDRTNKDRRIVTINLTDDGLDFCNSVNFLPKLALERKLTALSGDEKSVFLKLLKKLNKSSTVEDEKIGLKMMLSLVQKMLGFKSDPKLLMMDS